MENINTFDMIVAPLILILGFKGLLRGFIKEFFAIVGIVGGVFIASRVALNIGQLVNSIFPMQNENTMLLSGFVVALLIFWFVAYLVGVLLAKLFVISGLGIFDKILGFAFGASKIFLLFAIISYSVSQVKMINDNLEPKVKDSILFPYLKQAGGYIIKLDASHFQSTVTKHLDKVVDTTTKKIKELSKKELEKRAKELQKQLKETTHEQ